MRATVELKQGTPEICSFPKNKYQIKMDRNSRALGFTIPDVSMDIVAVATKVIIKQMTCAKLINSD